MAFGIPAEDFHGGFGIPHFESRDNYNHQPIYDDFDTQRQVDEMVEEIVYHYFAEYPVDCDDGTTGDVIFEWVKSTPNFVGTI